jgi:hypothetical protein
MFGPKSLMELEGYYFMRDYVIFMLLLFMVMGETVSELWPPLGLFILQMMYGAMVE